MAREGAEGARVVACATPASAPSRFYVLGLFFYLMANQNLVWFTFSSVPDLVTRYYCGGRSECSGMNLAVVDLLLNWGPICFVPATPFASWLLSLPGGLRHAMRLSALLSFLATLLRMVPTWLITRRDGDNAALFYMLHVAQILNGINGPILIAGPSRLSALWFPPEQRTLVTAIANASMFGSAIGFVAGPAITSNDPEKLPRLLLVTFIVSLVPLLCVAAHCPDRPTAPSSNSRSGHWPGPDDAARSRNGATTSRRFRWSIAWLMLAMALGVGVFDGWLGLLPQILARSPSFQGRPELAGLCGAASTVSCLLGMWSAGYVADRFFKARLKAFLLILSGLAAIAFAWLALSLENSWTSQGLPSSTWSLAVGVCLASSLRTASVPVIYELAAEVAYPEPEGTSAGMMVIAEHAALLIALFAAPHVDVTYVTLATLVSLGLCPLVLAMVKEEYCRSRAERPEHLLAE